MRLDHGCIWGDYVSATRLYDWVSEHAPYGKTWLHAAIYTVQLVFRVLWSADQLDLVLRADLHVICSGSRGLSG